MEPVPLRYDHISMDWPCQVPSEGVRKDHMYHDDFVGPDAVPARKANVILPSSPILLIQEISDVHNSVRLDGVDTMFSLALIHPNQDL